MDSPPASNPPSKPATPPLSRLDLDSDRGRILESILRIAAVKGYEMTTVAEVAETAGVPRGRFDELFADRQACFLAAYEAAIEIALAQVSSASQAARGLPWPRRVEAALRALVGLLSAEPQIVEMAMIELSAVGEEARVRARAAIERFAPLLADGAGSAETGAELPADTARFAVGGARALIFDEVRAGRGAELARILPELVFAVLVPYIGPEAAEEERRRVAATA